MAPHPYEANAQALLGRTLDDRYRIESLLGYGGMGLVFGGVQTTMQRPVAIKTLHPEFALAPQFFERFKREAEVASRLHHPNIITVFDFGRTSDGLCYCVMEYLAGESLRQRVRSSGPMTLREAVAVTEQAAQGLGHAHHQGVVHRDMKPQNIMLAEVDGRLFVKVLDFGLVKAAQGGDEEQLTSTGQILGTPQYMPPEQAGGDDVDQRSDLYALTGVLYFCLTGHSPFGANTVGKALQAALAQQVPPVATHRVGAPVPESIDAFLRKGLRADKAERHQTVEEFVAALNAAVAGVPDQVLDAAPEFSAEDAKERGSSAMGSARSAPTGLRQQTGSAIFVSKMVASATRAGPAVQRSDGPGPAAAPAGTVRWGAVAAALALLVALGLAAGRLFGGGGDPVPSGGPSTGAVSTRGQADAAAGASSGLPGVESPWRITLRTEPPGAEVLEGGAAVGRTPLTIEWARGAQRTFVFRSAGFADAEKTFKPASDVEFVVQLEPALHRTDPKKPKGPKRRPEDMGTFD